jgi:Tol biopolymer transport system component
VLSMNRKMIISLVITALGIALVLVTLATYDSLPGSETKELAHEERWGIYVLDLESNDTELIYSSANKISRIRLNNAGDQLVFSMQIDSGNECALEDSPINICEEICSININGEAFKRLTDNNVYDLIPCWSNDDSQIFFLSFRKNLDIFRMDADGSEVVKFYDSGFHDSDIHCSEGKLVFTMKSQIWMINEHETEPVQVTDPPRAGEWGNSVLPFGDYDPNLNNDGYRIVFERLVDDESVHGNYNIYVINVDGTEENALTDTGYTQGLPVWSHSGDQIVYLVSAIENEGEYDIYTMNADGSENRNVTPDYFPENFLCHDPIFSTDDSKILFVGEWYS